MSMKACSIQLDCSTVFLFYQNNFILLGMIDIQVESYTHTHESLNIVPFLITQPKFMEEF